MTCPRPHPPAQTQKRMCTPMRRKRWFYKRSSSASFLVGRLGLFIGVPDELAAGVGVGRAVGSCVGTIALLLATPMLGLGVVVGACAESWIGTALFIAEPVASFAFDESVASMITTHTRPSATTAPAVTAMVT